MKFIIFISLSTFLLICDVECKMATRTFPKDFQFGVSTSAYQVEGAWNADQRSESIWDRFAHTHPELIKGHSTGDIAADTYKHYISDAALLQNLGVSVYRFSISWSRLLPNGFNSYVSGAAVTFYLRFLEELVKYDILPMVVLHDYDLPQKLQELGGWANPLVQTWFKEYAKVAFEQFGDRVKYWITINNPRDMCYDGYGNWTKAPGANAPGVGEYLCIKNVLMAHAKVYRMYVDDFKIRQEGSCGISVKVDWFETHTESKQDILAATLKRQFEWGVFVDPIFSEFGGYPEEFMKRVVERSHKQRFTSRLPELTDKEIELIRGSADFLGIGHYTSYMVSATENRLQYSVPSMMDDVNVGVFFSNEWTASASSWLRFAEGSIYNTLRHIHSKYPSTVLYITENGWSTRGGLTDDSRVHYLRSMLDSVLDAIDHGVLVKGYIARSLLDGFELNAGYTQKFGLYEVDYEEESRTRVPRKSVFVYKAIIANRSIDFGYSGSAEIVTARRTAKPKYHVDNDELSDAVEE